MSDKMTTAQFEKEVKAVQEDKEMSVEQKARKIELLKAQLNASNENATRKGVGTRAAAGSTRGKGSIVITYEEFDLDDEASLPKSVAEFMKIANVEKQEDLLNFILEGYNTVSLRTASDPIAEYVNGSWDKDTIAQFRLLVRNMSKAFGVSIEDAVSVVKPGIEKKLAASAA